MCVDLLVESRHDSDAKAEPSTQMKKFWRYLLNAEPTELSKWLACCMPVGAGSRWSAPVLPLRGNADLVVKDLKKSRLKVACDFSF